MIPGSAVSLIASKRTTSGVAAAGSPIDERGARLRDIEAMQEVDAVDDHQRIHRRRASSPARRIVIAWPRYFMSCVRRGHDRSIQPVSCTTISRRAFAEARRNAASCWARAAPFQPVPDRSMSKTRIESFARPISASIAATCSATVASASCRGTGRRRRRRQATPEWR